MTDILAAAGRYRRRILYVLGGVGSVAAGLALWWPAGPSAGPIPSYVTVVTVTPVPASPPGTSPGKLDRAFTVTDPAKVARIAAVIDGLDPLPRGMDACQVDSGATMRLAFRASAAGPVVARVTAGYGCQLVSVSAGGQVALLLGDSSGSGQLMQQQVLAIAGVRWPYLPGTPSRSGA